jgi:hypothetical protein
MLTAISYSSFFLQHLCTNLHNFMVFFLCTNEPTNYITVTNYFFLPFFVCFLLQLEEGGLHDGAGEISWCLELMYIAKAVLK